MSLPKDNPFKNEPTIAKDIKRIMEGWVEGNAEDFLNENTISEGGMKAALADFMYSLPKAAIAEIKPLMKSKGGVAQQVMRLASITAILNKHGVAKKFMGFNAANLVNDYFDTFHGESVEVTEQFKTGDKVKVPHKGKMVKGKIIRYDNGGTSKAQQHGGGYVVDVGEPASIVVPASKVQKEEVERIAEATPDQKAKQAAIDARVRKMNTDDAVEQVKEILRSYGNDKTQRQMIIAAIKNIKEQVEVNELTNLRTYNNAYPNTMIASSKEMGEANDQSVKAAILILQSAANMASNPSKYGNLKIIGAIEQAIKQLKSASK
jgi:hypothetical protein